MPWGCLSRWRASLRIAGPRAPGRRSSGSVTAGGLMYPSGLMSCWLRASAGSLLSL